MPDFTEQSGRQPATEAGLACSGLPLPRKGERPAAYADRVGQWYAAQISERQRKAHGLFLTPVPVADFMAKRITAKESKVRILDPAAGAGILGCAAVEAIALLPKLVSGEVRICGTEKLVGAFA